MSVPHPILLGLAQYILLSPTSALTSLGPRFPPTSLDSSFLKIGSETLCPHHTVSAGSFVNSLPVF
jgi:hypothetical protein